MPSKKSCRRGGSDITKLSLDPYYLQRKLRGRGIRDWFSNKEDEEIEKLNAEILADIAAAKASKKKPTTSSTSSVSGQKKKGKIKVKQSHST